MGSNFVVMIVSLIVWIGIFFYLLRLDRKIKDLKRR
jgi:CcmD family protein